MTRTRYVLRAESPSPLVRAQLQAGVDQLRQTIDPTGHLRDAEDAARTILRGLGIQERTLASHQRNREPQPLSWTDRLENLLDALSVPLFTVETNNWVDNRAAIADWVAQEWARLRLPGEPTPDIKYANRWQRSRSLYRVSRSHGPTASVSIASTNGYSFSEIRAVAALPYREFS